MAELERAEIERKYNGAVDEYVDRLKRLKADFESYKQRVERDRELKAMQANEELITKLLPVMDELGLAIRNTPDKSADNEWINGIRLVEQHLRTILEKEGLTRIEAHGSDFDPEEHEAVFTKEGGREEQGKVGSVIREGYRLNDKVIRPAQVSVIKGIESPQLKNPRRTVPIRRGGT